MSQTGGPHGWLPDCAVIGEAAASVSVPALPRARGAPRMCVCPLLREGPSSYGVSRVRRPRVDRKSLVPVLVPRGPCCPHFGWRKQRETQRGQRKVLTLREQPWKDGACRRRAPSLLPWGPFPARRGPHVCRSSWEPVMLLRWGEVQRDTACPALGMTRLGELQQGRMFPCRVLECKTQIAPTF